jgi:hypothetical protein
VRLTPTDRKVAALVGEGFDIPMTAKEMGWSRSTVKHYRTRIFERLEIPGGTRDPHVVLGVYWNCELFQIGLKELFAA